MSAPRMIGPVTYGTDLRGVNPSIVAGVCEARALTMLAVTQDLAFASAAAQETLSLQAATGRLIAARRSWWRG